MITDGAQWSTELGEVAPLFFHVQHFYICFFLSFKLKKVISEKIPSTSDAVPSGKSRGLHVKILKCFMITHPHVSYF